MLAKIQLLISRCNELQLRLYICLSLIVCDLFTFFYFVTEAKKKDVVNQYIATALALKGIVISEIEPHFINDLRIIILSTLGTLLTLFFLVNFMSYYFFYKGKKWAVKYVHFLVISGFVLTAWVIVEGIKDFSLTQILNVTTIPLYLFAYKGLNSIKQNQELQNLPS